MEKRLTATDWEALLASLEGPDPLSGNTYSFEDTPEYERKLFEENNRREHRLWGDLIPLKRVLQRRGFGVWWADRELGLVSVDHKIMTVREFKRLARREQRVSGIK